MFNQQALSSASFPAVPYPLAYQPEAKAVQAPLPGHLSLPQYRKAVQGMSERGHGLDAISTILGLSPEEVLDLVVDCGLPTPHARKMRRGRSLRAWAPSDYLTLVLAYFADWQVGSIAEKLGRSKGSVFGKLFWLGLPKRGKLGLRRPSALQMDLPLPVFVPALSLDQQIARNRHRPRWLVANAVRPVVVSWKRKGREVLWTPELSRELAMRRWSNQRIEAVARDFGMPIRALTSQLYWLQIPPLPRSEMTMEYDPAVAAQNIADAKYHEVKCQLSDYRFWRSRLRRNHSRRDLEAGLLDATGEFDCYNDPSGSIQDHFDWNE